jgi:hypothetical protein
MGDGGAYASSMGSYPGSAPGTSVSTISDGGGGDWARRGAAFGAPLRRTAGSSRPTSPRDALTC